MSTWGTIEPTESLQTRLRLDFGLRPAILALNDWAVPGLGGVFFVRQLTWSCLGIRLAGELDRPAMAARIAEGIEALASWTALRSGGYEKDDRVQGKRKLRRQDGLSFNAVSVGGAYVTVPFRRAATSALPGLGFCMTGQPRFNALQLAPPGLALAETVLLDTRIAERLRNWVMKPDTLIKNSSEQLKRALLPSAATAKERQLISAQLMADANRARIVNLLQPLDTELSPLRTKQGITAFLRQVNEPVHRARLDACFAFEQTRASALKAAQTLADSISEIPRSWSTLANAPDVQLAFDRLQRDCEALAARLDKLSDLPADIRFFCNEHVQTTDLERRIRALATRVPQVFTVSQQELDRGMGYTATLIAAEPTDPSEDGVSLDALPVPRPLLRLKRLYNEIQGSNHHDA